MADNRWLIDADAFIKHFERAKEIAKVIPGELGNILRGLYDEVIEEIKKQPTVDAVEVVHGRWIQSEPGYRLCSHCMADVAIYSGHKNYCPNCGADMRERKDNG